MNDKKRLNAEGKHVITQGEKDAWKRGKKDAAKNFKLSEIRGVTPDKAIKVVRLFAEGMTEQYIMQKTELTADSVKKVLTRFSIGSIEDARRVVQRGIISELDEAKLQAQESSTAEQRITEAEQAGRLKDHKKEFGDKPEISDQEKDLKLHARRDEAQEKNKIDKLKAMIAQGVETSYSKSGFQIRLVDTAAFKSMIPYGVSSLQRRFGGSKKDIVAEIRRISPETDTDMLRP
jgi:hypothetical protein